MTFRRLVYVVVLVSLVWTSRVWLPARQSAPVSPALFAEMRWRNIGPLRAGRTKAAAGVPSQPYTFYIGVCNGGVWKTTDAGRTWKPLFDGEPTGSVGWVTVAPSDPNIVYVASGEGLPRPDLSVGDGIYKSTDAGKTWTHLPGLRDAQQIPKIVVDPRNPNRIFVAALGHPYGPNEERGIFRSLDGGQTFEKVLYKDPDTGGKDVDIDPVNPDVVYATMWEQRQGPWENGAWNGTNGGIFKSIDGGKNWTQLKNGLPDVVNAEMAIAPSDTKRLYAVIEAAGGGGGGRGGAGRGGGGEPAPNPRVYRSDNGGESWMRTTTDMRPANRPNEAVPIVDPKNADTLLLTDVVTYKSTDGAKTFVPFKGAPGGDDYQNAWINPNDTNIILLVSDQGGVVSLNGGASWSSWYTQSTAALYHVMTDNAFPYRVCGGQQDSGSVCISSRGNDGHVTVREWHPVAVEEYGYAAPDPLDPDVIYGGKITRYDRRTTQVSNISPPASAAPATSGGPTPGPGGPFRTVRTLPVVFSLADPHVLFFGNNYLWKTIDGGVHWTRVSPDLTRKTHDVPKSIGKYSETAKGQVDSSPARVIYTIGPSYVDVNRIWVGTDDGVIATTADGGLHWNDVTPPKVGAYWKVFTIDPGRFDALTAYAAVNTLRIDDMNPHLFRTHDGGKTWTEIITGIPGGAPVSVIREDPKKKGLLFAGSETQVYVSFDDGDHWQSLRLNMAASSVRDLVIKDDDVVVGTHGRGIWILDDITPLRQIDAKTADADAVLFKPTTALRVRWNTNSDTPWPPDEPALPNPPEGAIINYYLKSAASGPVTLEILQTDGRLVRRYSSADPVAAIPDPSVAPLPQYWYRPPQHLSTEPGMHRFTWDVHYQPLGAGGGGRGGGGGLPIAAVPFDTVAPSAAPWVNPGTYTVKLTVNGKSYTQPITVKQDPRVKTPALAMQQLYTLTKASYFGAADAQAAASQAASLRSQVADLTPKASGATAETLAAFDRKLSSLLGASEAAAPAGRGGRGGRGGAPAGGSTATTLSSAESALAGSMSLLQGADVTPPASSVATMTQAQQAAAGVMARWTTIKTVDLAAVNAQLKTAGLAALTVK
ncbi:MAG TPA: hypothetical protein VJN96_23660 [Vicinamibacterales bacterium]|nr:hypothetical protein [Vicinamibacterales bacterium]